MYIHHPVPELEFVTGVAIQTPDGKVWSLPKPYRYSHLLCEIHKHYGRHFSIIKEQGFTTNIRPFVDRFEARVVARNAGQLLLTAHLGKFLWTEDVW